MRLVAILLLLFAGWLPTTRAEYLSPLDVLKADGKLFLTDGVTLYVFSLDHTFHAFPDGNNGRTYDGTWSAEQTNTVRCTFTVEAEQGWINGASLRGEYRKIVFRVYGGSNHVVNSRKVWGGTYYMDDPVKIQKPADWPIE